VVKADELTARITWTCVGSLLLLWGCAATPRGSSGPAGRTPGAEDLRARAEQLWQARQKEDWSTVYVFEEPGRREGLDQQQFEEWHRKNEPFVIHDYKLGRVQTDGPLGWVEVQYRSTIRQFPALAPREAQRWEKWRLTDGQWYPVPRNELDRYPESPAVRNAAEEDRLRARFQEAWQARQRGDWAALHALLEPRAREGVTVDQLATDGQRLEYRSCQVQWVEVIGDRGQVRVAYEVKRTDPNLSKMPPEITMITERWLRIEGEWYRQMMGGAK